MSLLAAA